MAAPYYAGRPSALESLRAERRGASPRAAGRETTYQLTRTEKRQREKARDFGCYFCVVCEEPIRGVVCYSKGSACHFGCQGEGTTELLTLERLEPCQETALKNVREATRSLHEAALPRLRERMSRLSFAPEDVDVTLAWIRDQAPIIIHVDLARFATSLAEDTHYRNQFETDTSNGTLSHSSREQWEADLFDSAYADALPVDRCKYGVLNVTNDPQGVRRCSGYGTSYLLLKNVRLRTTFAAQDSAGIDILNLATVDYYAHVLEQYSDEELRAAVEVGTRRAFGRDSEVIVHYKEAQIHGEVNLAENVELIMVHPSLRNECNKEMLQKLAERCQAQIAWIETDSDEDNSSPLHFELGGSSSTCDHDRTPGDATPASGMSAEDKELQIAMAASRADAAEASTLADAIAAEERSELARAVELSATFLAGSTPAPLSEDALMEEAIKASLALAEEEETRRRAEREWREQQEMQLALELSAGGAFVGQSCEEDGLTNDIQASLAAVAESKRVHESEAPANEAARCDPAPDVLPDYAVEALSNSSHVLAPTGQHVVKATLGDDTRRLQVAWASTSCASEVIAAISEVVQQGYSLPPGQPLEMKYTGAAGEMHCLVEAKVQDFLAAQRGPLRILVETCSPLVEKFAASSG